MKPGDWFAEWPLIGASGKAATRAQAGHGSARGQTPGQGCPPDARIAPPGGREAARGGG